MTTPQQWLPIPPDLKLGQYRVLFQGGTEGIAALTHNGWSLIEESAHRPKDAPIVAFKHLGKTAKEEIKFSVTRGVKGMF